MPPCFTYRDKPDCSYSTSGDPAAALPDAGSVWRAVPALGVCDNPPAQAAGRLSTHTFMNKTVMREMASKEASPKYLHPKYNNL